MTMTYDDWLQDPYHDQTFCQDDVNEKVKELTSEGADFDPYDWQNFTNALCNANVKEIGQIFSFSIDKEYEKLGKFIHSLVVTEMEKRAEKQAIEDFEQDSVFVE